MLSAKPGKRTIIDLSCTEQAFPEIPELLFGTSVDSGIQYFDATDYFNKKGLQLVSVEDFSRNYFHPISALIKAYELDKDQVRVYNSDGHVLYDSHLLYLFVSYTNPDFLAHINDRIHELFKKGFCVSDTYLFHAAKSRISPGLLNNESYGNSE